MNQNDQGNTGTNLKDLAVGETEQTEIKGGPKKIFIGGLSVAQSQTALPDLEPQGEIKGGPGSGAGGVWLNHNETITIEDLEAPNAADIKGGETLTLGGEQDEESIKKPSTISMKLRKPAK